MGNSIMERAIVTKGRLESSRTLILDEDIPFTRDSFEIIILKTTKGIEKTKRKAVTLKGLIHMRDDFDMPLEDFKEYM